MPGRRVTELVELLESVQGLGRHQLIRRLRDEAFTARQSAQQLRMVERIGDGIGKFGGGSLLTTTVALIVGGKIGPALSVIVVLTLASFITGTILAALFEYRAATWDIDADRILAAIEEMKEPRNG